ncbi:S41 family peptidase [Chitinophaga barathri]|uniref:Tail specific protease domain-containing protein n=1 Tax=Chitinophaga barathri TaxID=1647451 RepID=A0A3N4M7A6_9BACT|nr:S41 family peptidase [Chitinophaga barathri]RPD39065.1 hypothetical protein EG028_20820 [Chitinophaga barathri]
MIKLRIIGTVFLCAAALAACKKSSKTEPDPPGPTTPTTGSRLELSLDTLYLFAKETYLWYDAIPDYNTFNPRGYAGSDDLASLKSAMYKISQLKENPTTQKPYEYYIPSPSRSKFSFVESGNLARGIKGALELEQSAVDLEGDGNDMGFLAIPVTFTTDPGKRYVYVAYVEKGSPANVAGLTRGCLITRVNGAAPPTDAGSLSSLTNSTTLSLEFTRPNNTQGTVNLTKTAYKNDPLTTYKVIQGTGGNKIGYLTLMRFSRIGVVKPSLDEAFNAFTAAGVNSLVVDLRYNGGGYVETFEYLANLIAPNALNGKVMYKEQFNDLLQQGKAPILKSLPLLDANYKQQVSSSGKPLTYADVDFSLAGNVTDFSKKGTLNNVGKVVFIITGSSASASELTINSLAAWPEYIDVKTVGSTSYGKPVGFFGIGIDKFTVYMSQFSSTNADNEGNYYAGMTPNMPEQDLVTKDFGDVQESSLAKAINYINTGSTGRLSNARIAIADGTVINASDLKMDPVVSPGFNGMIEHRRRLKPE